MTARGQGEGEAPSVGRPLDELAAISGTQVAGAPGVKIDRVASLEAAGAGAISFLANPRYRAQLAVTGASAVVLSADDLPNAPQGLSCLVGDEPYLAFAHIVAYLHPVKAPAAGVASTASVARSVQLGRDVSIAPGAVIAANADLGDGVAIGANAVIGEGVAVGARSRIAAQAVVDWGCRVGADVIVHSGSVIGADGFGFAPSADGWVKMPQLGIVTIGDGVEVGANCCIDRAALGETIVEAGVKLDNYVQIAHNVQVGRDTVMAAKSGISGSTVVGSSCRIAGGVGIGGHLNIASGTVITAMSMITHDIPEAGMYSSGTPMSPTREWRRNAVRFNDLDRTARRVSALERRLDHLSNNNKGD